MDTGELGSPAVPRLHTLRSSEVLKNEIMWHSLRCGDIQLQVGSDDLGDLSMIP